MSKFKSPKLLAACMALSAIAVLFLVVMYFVTSKYSQFKYAITIDAGSTHSTAILFRWKADKLRGTGEIEELGNCHVEQGISSYSKNYSQAGEKLMHCVRDLATMLDRATQLDHTFVYLGATAGMRMLNMSDPTATQGIFDAIKAKFKSVGLQTGRISIINGKEEGLYAWVAANALTGALTGNSPSNGTYGILDMGGASAQIAHQIRGTHHSGEIEDTVNLQLYGANYTVYAFSNFCFGMEQSLNRYLRATISNHISSKGASNNKVEVPCLPKGYHVPSSHIKKLMNNVCISPKQTPLSEGPLSGYELVGTSEYDKCRHAVDQMLDQHTCERNYRFCMKKSTHPKEGIFYAVSAYTYLTEALDLRDHRYAIDMNEYLKASRQICENSEDQLKQNKRLPAKFRAKYCFQLAYVYSTLTKVYHFDQNSWPNLRFTNEVNGKYLGWVLGFMISASNAIPSEEVRFGGLLLEAKLYTIPAALCALLFVVCAFCLYQHIKRKGQAHRSISLSMSQVA